MQSHQAWSEAAIRDTVAAIVRQADYRRSASDMIWTRIIEWVERALRWLQLQFLGSSNGRIVVTVLAIALAIIVVARLVIGVRENSEQGRTRMRRQKFTGVDHFAVAERLAAEGDHTAAAHALCAGVISLCALRGEVRLHDSKTTGDYAREMRRRHTRSATQFQAFRLRYDRAVYRERVVSAEEYGALVDAAMPLREMEALAA